MDNIYYFMSVRAHIIISLLSWLSLLANYFTILYYKLSKKQEIYAASSKSEKTQLSTTIVIQLLNANPPRRFLEKKSSATAAGSDDNAGQWVEVPLKRAVTKTSQALRDTARDGRAKQKERGSAIHNDNGGGAHNLQSFQQQQQQQQPEEQQLTALSKDGSINNINPAAAAPIVASGMTASHQSLKQGIPFSPIVPSPLTSSANNNQQVRQDEGRGVLFGPPTSMEGGDDNGAATNTFGQKFGEGIENELLDNFLDDFGSGLLDDIDDIVDSAPIGIDKNGGVENQSVAVALADWILKEFACKGGCGGGGGQLTMSAYLNSALSIAIKLTEVVNDFPLESILLKNVFVASSSAMQLGMMNALQQQEDDFTVVIRCQPSLSGLRGGVDVDGTLNDRLFAVGKILVPLFSGAVDEVGYDDSKRSSSPTMDSINLNSSERPAKRKQAKPSHVSAQLERLGLPPPVKTILSDLLECGQGEFVGDEAYTSFGDLLVDLKLLKKAGLSSFLQSPSIEVCDKICGREKEIEALNASYNNPNTQGILIMGTGGVGKSRMATLILQQTRNDGGLIFCTKFEQNQDVLTPLARICAIFSDMIDLFVTAATPSTLLSISNNLDNTLGNHASLLYEVLPSLARIMPSCCQVRLSHIDRTNMANSMRFLFCKLLEVLTSYQSAKITLLFDDVQWADLASLGIISSLLHNNETTKRVYFTFCFRDNEVNNDWLLWLNSISAYSLDRIKLESLNPDGVNEIVSEALHLFPRLTRPLSSVLHRKTGGNPLIVRHLLSSIGRFEGIASPSSTPRLKGGEIYFSLSRRRWAWDVDKIEDLEMADDVVSFLVAEMQQLSEILMFGLKVAACIGSRMSPTVIGTLSAELNICLNDTLVILVKRGFLSKQGSGSNSQFGFGHDKVQEAAYGCMSSEEQRANHIRFGLALYPRSPVYDKSNDELLFLAINQMNKAGPHSVFDADQKHIIASLNLNAGKRAGELSDFQTAFSLFRHGISFLPADCWEKHYETTVELYDSAAEAAVLINDLDVVALYVTVIHTQAKCFEDKLNCMKVKLKALIHEKRFVEAMETFLMIMNGAGEPALLPVHEITSDMKAMSAVMDGLTNAALLSLSTMKRKRTISLMNIYCDFAQILLFVDPTLSPAISLRMMQITVEEGLCSKSPIVFSRFAQSLLLCNEIGLSIRFGRLAMKLLEREDAAECSPSVYSASYYVLWLAQPFQAMIEGFKLGKKVAEQSGDVYNTLSNYGIFCLIGYITGESLGELSKKSIDCISCMKDQNMVAFLSLQSNLHSHLLTLTECNHAERADDANSFARQQSIFDKQVHESYQLIRSFLFRELDSESCSIADKIFDPTLAEEPFRAVTIFYVGLVAFYFAREEKDMLGDRALKWMKIGEDALNNVECWSSHSAWNFQNKLLLLRAEKKYCMGETDSAKSLYEESILSAQEHKFVHEEGIAHELCGHFSLERGHRSDALRSFNSSVKCYLDWGALAVARRLENFVCSNFPEERASSGLMTTEGETAA